MDKLRNMNLVIVKVGTNTLTTTQGKTKILNTKAFALIGQEVRELSSSGTGIILVTSAGITAGMVSDGVRREDVMDSAELQRYAARGWRKIVDKWEASIGQGQVTSALLTKHELHSESTHNKTLDALARCLSHGDIFIVNENDIICDDEIKFGDNDTLAGELAAVCAKSELFNSVRLVLLTDIDGLRRDKDDATTLMRMVTNIEEVKKFAGGAANEHSRGGMATKVRAAEIAKHTDGTFIVNGSEVRAITRALKGEIGTRFKSR